jgi:hypothetical protein
MKTQDQLIEWIVAHVTAFSPSYFERKRIILVGFFGPDTVFEFDGVQMHDSDQSSLKSRMTKIRRGSETWVFMATMEGDAAFRLRSIGMRGSGGNALYAFEIVDKVLVVKLESQMIMA